MKNGKTTLKVSKDIELRLPQVSYADELFCIVDRERSYLRTWLNWVDDVKKKENTLEFIRTSQVFNKGGQRLSTIIFKGEQIVGSLSLIKINKPQKIAEIGYWLSEHQQGQGIITDSCRRIIEYTFRTLDINRIEIRVASPNKKSQGIPRRLGFIHEGTLREALFLYDNYFDLELFSLIRSDWQTD